MQKVVRSGGDPVVTPRCLSAQVGGDGGRETGEELLGRDGGKDVGGDVMLR